MSDVAPTTTGLIEIATLASLRDALRVQGEHWLGEDERVRVDKITAPRRREQFLAGHLLVRRMAHALWGGAWADWSLQARTGGGWRFHRQPSIHLSLSHCADWVAAAVSTSPVGIDLELPSGPRDFMALADFVFSPAECRSLGTIQPDETEGAFLRFWALKEAHGKHGGHGLLPRRARLHSAVACEMPQAEARTWAFAGGVLAVVGEIHKLGVHVPTEHMLAADGFWRFQAAADHAGV